MRKHWKSTTMSETLRHHRNVIALILCMILVVLMVTTGLSSHMPNFQNRQKPFKSTITKEKRYDSVVDSLICNATKPKFASPPLPLTALATFPGSGNTWMRHLIQQLTGYYTGSIYNDYGLKHNGFSGESVKNGSVIVIKTHARATKRIGNKKFQRAILVVRSPYGALKAEYTRQKRGQVGVVSENSFSTADWRKFFVREARYWLPFYRSWFTQLHGPRLVIFYEEMLSDLKPVLRQVCKFLGMSEVCTEERIECVYRNSEGNYHRNATAPNRDPYSQNMRATIEKYKQNLHVLLNACVKGGGCVRGKRDWPW